MPVLLYIGILLWGSLTGCRSTLWNETRSAKATAGTEAHPIFGGDDRRTAPNGDGLGYDGGYWKGRAPHGMVRIRGPGGNLLKEQSYYRGLLRWEKQWDSLGHLVFKRTYRSSQHALSGDLHPGMIQKYTFYVKEGEAILHGPVLCLTQDGELVRQWEMKDGRREGEYTEWYVNGGVSQRGTYNKGLREGLWLAYHPSGIPAFRGDYREDKKEGPHLYWHPNGMLQRKALYQRGELLGEAQSWYASGHLKEKRMGPEGYVTASWYPNGQQAYVFRGDPRHGKAMSKRWYPNGQLRCRIKYRNGDTHGKTQTWHQNGAPFVTARYHTGQLTGTVKTWSEKGRLVSRQKFHRGRLTEDPDQNRLANFLEAGHAELPLEFEGFRWGMNRDQVATQIKRLRGRVMEGGIGASHSSEMNAGVRGSGLNAVIQFPGLSRPMAFFVEFNPWGELCALRGRLPSVPATGLSRYRNWMEGELQARMLLSTETPSIRKKTLKQVKSWGAFQTEANGTSDVHPVVEAQLTYDSVLEELNISLENHLMRLYANPSASIVSGPRYPGGNT